MEKTEKTNKLRVKFYFFVVIGIYIGLYAILFGDYTTNKVEYFFTSLIAFYCFFHAGDLYRQEKNDIKKP